MQRERIRGANREVAKGAKGAIREWRIKGLVEFENFLKYCRF